MKALLKRRPRKVTAAVLLVLCASLLSSCFESSASVTISPEAKELFKSGNPEMFLNAECNHMPGYKGAAPEADATYYHCVYCRTGGCDFEQTIEPHKVKTSTINVSHGSLKENLRFYHYVTMYCSDCKARLIFYVLCKNNKEECHHGGYPDNLKCLDDADWREILCDTPLEISDD